MIDEQLPIREPKPVAPEPRGMLAQFRKLAESSVPWGILGLLGLGLLGGGASEDLKHLVQQNGAVLLLVAILIQYAPRAIESQREQARAMADLSAAVREVATRDDYERREVLGVLQVLAEEVREMKAEVRRAS